MNETDNDGAGAENSFTPKPDDVVPPKIEAVPDPDPFDPKSFRTSGISGVAVDSVLQVTVGKPSKQAFFRLHPDPEFRLPCSVLTLKDERETYLVLPDVALLFPGETSFAELRFGIYRTGGLFLWPVPQPDPGGRKNKWNESAREAAEFAGENWTRMVADMAGGYYQIKLAPAGIAAPVWPKVDMATLLKRGFGDDGVIRSETHPVLRRLLGRE